MTMPIAQLRLKRQMLIHTVLQVAFIMLLLYMAYHFQRLFLAKGMPNIFYNSIFTTLFLQACLFYPIYRFASSEAKRELAEQSSTDPNERQNLRRQRLYGDFMKGVIFIFYTTFILLAPAATFIMSTAFFSFIATAVTYLQSFNSAAKRLLSGTEADTPLTKRRA